MSEFIIYCVTRAGVIENQTITELKQVVEMFLFRGFDMFDCMRLLLKLQAEEEMAYNTQYHHKLRGALWGLLEDSEYSELHDDPNSVPFSFSNPFPVRATSEGDIQKVIVASPHHELVEDMKSKFDEKSEFTIGEQLYTPVESTPVQVDVGEPGTSGILSTATGVYCGFKQGEVDKYGLSFDVERDEQAWTPDKSFEVFTEKLLEVFKWKHSQIFPEYLEEPEDWSDLFDGFELLKTYGVKIPVSHGGHEWTFVVSKFDFEYTVRNEDHRRWLNMLLDTGIGQRNRLGFGFLNIIEKDGDEL